MGTVAYTVVYITYTKLSCINMQAYNIREVLQCRCLHGLDAIDHVYMYVDIREWQDILSHPPSVWWPDQPEYNNLAYIQKSVFLVSSDLLTQ